MPDQVEPAADTQRFPHTANIFPLRERDRKSIFFLRRTTADCVRLALIMQAYSKLYTIWFIIPGFGKNCEIVPQVVKTQTLHLPLK